MNKEELIKKWLDHNLNAEEQIAFEALDDYDELVKLTEATKGFEAPDYDADAVYNNIVQKRQVKSQKSWLAPLLKLAAVVLIGFSVFYFTSNTDTTTNTMIAQQTELSLPDASSVTLNAKSSLVYNKNSWENNRDVSLNGEAYFKVAKGSKFNVITNDGTVTVLGTEFNVKQRNNYFEVTCFEGSVAVKHNLETVKLKPGEQFIAINGVIKNKAELKSQPSWLNQESDFTSVPLNHVLNEFERQYNITFNTELIDTNIIFTGSFTHKNLDLALKSVTLPLGLKYTKSEAVIVLKRE